MVGGPIIFFRLRKKSIIYFSVPGSHTIRFEYSNILEHQQATVSAPTTTAAAATTASSRWQSLRQQHKRPHHKINNTFFTRFLLLLVWQMIARFIFRQFNTDRIFAYTAHLICYFLCFFSILPSISNFHKNFVFFIFVLLQNILSLSSLPFLSLILYSIAKNYSLLTIKYVSICDTSLVETFYCILYLKSAAVEIDLLYLVWNSFASVDIAYRNAYTLNRLEMASQSIFNTIIGWYAQLFNSHMPNAASELTFLA